MCKTIICRTECRRHLLLSAEAGIRPCRPQSGVAFPYACSGMASASHTDPSCMGPRSSICMHRFNKPFAANITTIYRFTHGGRGIWNKFTSGKEFSIAGILLCIVKAYLYFAGKLRVSITTENYAGFHVIPTIHYVIPGIHEIFINKNQISCNEVVRPG